MKISFLLILKKTKLMQNQYLILKFRGSQKISKDKICKSNKDFHSFNFHVFLVLTLSILIHPYYNNQCQIMEMKIVYVKIKKIQKSFKKVNHILVIKMKIIIQQFLKNSFSLNKLKLKTLIAHKTLEESLASKESN